MGNYSTRTNKFANMLQKRSTVLCEKKIDKSDFDKTYIGIVSEQITLPDGKKTWRIQTNGTAYDIETEKCNISKVGQKVRLYIPNHNYRNKYAEVIDDSGNIMGIEVVTDGTNDISSVVFTFSDETTSEYNVEYDTDGNLTKFGDIDINWS